MVPRTTVAGVVAVAVLATNVGVAGQSNACGTDLPLHVRVMDCRIAARLAEGLARSPSLRLLVEQVGTLKGLVFVRLDRMPKEGVVGGLSHQIAVAGEFRHLHIALARDYAYDDRVIVTLAHEFQHALEVLQHPDAQTEAEIAELYRRIGFIRGNGVVETDAALAIERVVRKELRARKKGHVS